MRLGFGKRCTVSSKHWRYTRPAAILWVALYEHRCMSWSRLPFGTRKRKVNRFWCC